MKAGKPQQAGKPQAVAPAHGNMSEKNPPDRK